MEARYKRASKIFCSQFDIPGWRDKLAGPILADAICDRIIHDSYMIIIGGQESMFVRDICVKQQWIICGDRCHNLNSISPSKLPDRMRQHAIDFSDNCIRRWIGFNNQPFLSGFFPQVFWWILSYLNIAFIIWNNDNLIHHMFMIAAMITQFQRFGSPQIYRIN